ncbi:hypothetical protein JQC67_17400 [Aurantibacter crassamenti]|uniref:hypothetical protein n=1 Tax=Aurantibacter crassamenti TaxID=1837375 RepID=UPI00193A62E7|nr:hypothetical protein [Aurantibacter crassamenti]MBM1107935.1 hypothetical protein [Aurantibacter crassamenti]
MRLTLLILTFIIGLIFKSNAQNASDQIFMSNGETIAATVKKVEPNTVTYSYIGENLENIVDKSEILKIIFKSGREQMFTQLLANNARDANFEYPNMLENEGAVLPFEFVLDGSHNNEEGKEAQKFYYDNVMRKPERNTINYQDVEITRKRLRKAGLKDWEDMQDIDMKEIAKIVGAGIIITGKIIVDYRSTTSSTSGSSTTKVDTKKKKIKTYSSDYNTSMDEFDTKVIFRIYDKNGNKIIDQTRRPFLASTKDHYVTALNYLMKRTPYYQK